MGLRITETKEVERALEILQLKSVVMDHGRETEK